MIVAVGLHNEVITLRTQPSQDHTHVRGRHGFSRGRDFACEVGRGLFRLGVAHRGKREYSLCAKASPCEIFCSGCEE